MELNIKLIGSVGRLENREPFIVADNEKLMLRFMSDTRLDDVYLTLNNGVDSARYRLAYLTSYEVPKNFIKAGTLKITINALYASQIVQTFTVEPIIIKDLNGDYKGFTEVEEVKKNYDELKNNYDELVAKVNQLIDVTNKQSEDIQHLYNAVEQGEF